MDSLNAALLINLLGFTVGVALYSLLLLMVLGRGRQPNRPAVSPLLLATSALGLLWNLGELYVFVVKDFGAASVSPLLTAFSYSALGFLPSVVVHSGQEDRRRISAVTIAAYSLSTAAAVLHLHSALEYGTAPSDAAMQMLTIGSLCLAAGLLVLNFRQRIEKKAIWATALLIFASSALHLTGESKEGSWFVELVAHQSSLPLALVILYQNYKFALGDLFLKRAISLILLAAVAFGMYVFVAAPMLRYHETHDRDDVLAVSLLITLWMATALVYPSLHKAAIWIVDRAILRRADYASFQAELAKEIDAIDSVGLILDRVCDRVAAVLTANEAGWEEITDTNSGSLVPIVDYDSESAAVTVPTAEQPGYKIKLGAFDGGRRLLSDETAMLESAGLAAARRIDAVRVTHERCEQEFREQEFSKLAAEAQLTALRSQINPHFLFNALTTIGYLIHADPEKASETLIHLTRLLRSVLRSTGEFCTLGAEIKLIEDYLDIEKARFEDRLEVEFRIPEQLQTLSIPALILQPLVENAVKHAVSLNKSGGKVTVEASLRTVAGESFLDLDVTDTGPGATVRPVEPGGIGLRNIRDRLESHYGRSAHLEIRPTGNGTRAEITLPVEAAVV